MKVHRGKVASHRQDQSENKNNRQKTSEKWNAICFGILLIFDSNEVLFVGIYFYVNLVLGIITGTDREPSMLTLVSRLRSRDIGRCSVYQYFA